MRVWTVHLPPAAARGSVPSIGKRGITKPGTAKPTPQPVLLREGWSFWALVFGPLWLLRHGCWTAGLSGVLVLMVGAVLPAPWSFAVFAVLHAALCLHGQDARRWTLARRGWKLAHVVAGRDEEGALFRLVSAEPRLAAQFADPRA